MNMDSQDVMPAEILLRVEHIVSSGPQYEKCENCLFFINKLLKVTLALLSLVQTKAKQMGWDS